MSNNKNAYGSRKRPLSETINNLKSYYDISRDRINFILQVKDGIQD